MHPNYGPVRSDALWKDKQAPITWINVSPSLRGRSTHQSYRTKQQFPSKNKKYS